VSGRSDFRFSPLRSGEVSELTTHRLSVYLRCLQTLAREGAGTISSKDLAARFHLNSAQIRKDLANFGEFGIRGVGYDVLSLRDAIVRILGLDEEKKVAIVGAGKLGLALADYAGFNTGGFRVAALFDSDPALAGIESHRGARVHPMDQLEPLVRELGIEIGVLAIPPHAAQQAYDRLADAGVPAVLNFSPVRIALRPTVKIKSVDLKISLEALSYHLTRRKGGWKGGAKGS
jgi:redox-sensing transcriptional repressor